MPAPAVSSLVVSHPGATQAPSDANKFGQHLGNEDDKGSTISRPSQLKDKTRLFDILKGWFRADATHSATWRVEAKEMFDFRAGEQWNTEDKQILNAQSRPEITFNRVLTILKAVAGMEINGRHEITYSPRHNEDTAVNELLSGAGKWLTDECDAEDEESQAFDDCNTCGMGWTEHRLDYEENKQGMYIEERIDPLEMYWDRTGKRKNLVDARRIARAKKMPLADAMQMWPGKSREDLDAVWAIGTELDSTAKTIEEKRKREENTTDTDYDDMYEVTIVNMMWFEREVYWMVADPVTNKVMELSDDEYKRFSARSQMMAARMNGGKAPEFAAVEMTRKVYKEAFLGGEVLSVGEAPLGRFKWTPITGEFNRTRGQFFGLVKVMRDPQMWANKWLSQSLHILNSTAKGGIVAEIDAFEDTRDAEEKWSRPDAIVWTKRGALSGDKPKVMPRPGGAFPQGHIQLMEFAISAIRDVTGINLELLGLKDQNQPGILEAQRKQAGMTVLATVFDSLRRFRKMGGRIRLHIIQNYLSDGRLIRITGSDGNPQAIPLMKSAVVGEYEVIISDAPSSPNQKEQNWLIISQMLPAFKDQLVQNPEMLVLLLEYSPLPTRVITALKQMMAKKQPQVEQQQNMGMAALAAKTQKDNAQAELFLSQAQKEEKTALYDMAIAMHQFKKAQNESDLTSAKAAHERVKAAVAALTPIETPPNSAADQRHEHALRAHDSVHDAALQVSDHQHEARQQLGKHRFELVKTALEQNHERQMGNQQERMQASQQDHERRMGAAQAGVDAATQQRQHGMDVASQLSEQGADAASQAADQTHEGEMTASKNAAALAAASMNKGTG
jgi:hypothetical protein